MANRITLLVLLCLGGLAVFAMSVYVVDQRKSAIVFQLGEVKRVVTTPGLRFKVPLIQNVKMFDKRILTMDAGEPDRFITSEKKNVLVDSFVKWQIDDVEKYYKTVGGDEKQAEIRLRQAINDGLRAEFGRRTVHEVVSGQRDQIMDIISTKANVDAARIGVRVVDVRLKRVDLPDEVSSAVYERMRTERKRAANMTRSEGEAKREELIADADRQRTVILSEAFKQAQQIKGEGDAEASAIYARSYGQNSEFFAFYRSLEAYKESFKGKRDVMVVDPTGNFFRYLKQADKPAGSK